VTFPDERFLAMTDNEGNTAMHWVTTPRMARLLMEHGAGINTRNNRGLLPLHVMARDAPLLMVREFIGLGADLLAKTTIAIRLLFSHLSTITKKTRTTFSPTPTRTYWSNAMVIEPSTQCSRLPGTVSR